jgi:catechol 2,3-dioxygenase-like lactoylglutathione lyase family enzyme
MRLQLRVARPVRDLSRAADMYRLGLGLMVIARFENHQGFDGVMLGTAGANYHLEFTRCAAHEIAPSPTPEDLLVWYFPDPREWARRCHAMLDAGFTEVSPFNPYWANLGRTFADPDGYRTVLQQAEWSNG